MSTTDPLLQNAVPAAHSGSEAKIFFTAHELLQHVRRKYQVPADTRKTSKRYTLMQRTSPGLFVADHPESKLTDLSSSVEVAKTLRYGEARLHKLQSFDVNRALFLTEGNRHTSKDAGTDGYHGKCSHAVESERKVLKLDDKSQTTLVKNNTAADKNKSVAVTLLAKANCSPQEKISYEKNKLYKRRPALEDIYGRKQMCFFQMSSMHSPRIQCCCCAVGVFAAMFGIFMLSAGICIVLNVTFMEVDTSGLPPDLHNEQGKKVVGIILICVALAFLGLSATVSILYFTLCSRKNQDATKQQKTTSPVGVTAGQERVRNRESVLAGKKRATSSNLNVVTVHRSGMHLHAEFSKKKSYHVLRNHPALPPHQEEEADIAKSSTELNRADEAFSTTTHHGKKLKQRDRREEPPKSLDVQVICSSSQRAPVIVVDTFHENLHLGTDEMETQLNNSDLGFDEDSVIQTVLYSERRTEAASGGSVFQIATNNSSVSSNGLATLRHNDLSKSNLKPHPALLHNVSIETELSSSSSTLVSSTCPSTPEPQQHVLVVKPAKGASSGSVTYVPSTVDRVFEEDRDSLSHITVISHHQDNHTVLQDENEGGFSRSHFNSAFSCDGNDPLQGDVK